MAGIITPSYRSGFYSPERGGIPKYPELWDGCVGAWAPSLGPTGLTLRDQSAYINHGTLMGMDPATDWVVDGGQYALDFDDANDYLAMPETTPNLSGDMTASFWFKTPSTSGSVNNHVFGFYKGNSGFSGWAIDVPGTVGVTRGLSFWDGSGWRNSVSDLYIANQWTHFAVAVKGTTGATGTVYANGVARGTLTIGAGSRSYTGAKAIGGRAVSVGNYFNGELDDLRLYRRALTAAEVATLAQRRGIAYETAPRRNFFVPAGGGNTLTADTGTFTLTGHAVSLPVTRTLTAAEGTFALTGHAATLPVTRTLTAATGEFTLTGHAATLPVTRQLTAAEGTFALTGHAALFPVTRKLAAATGEFTLTGNDVTLTPVVGNTLVASRGQFQLTGNDAAFSVTRSLTAAVGEFTLTGIDTAFSVTRSLASATGTFALTGHDASIALVAPNVLTAESGAFTYTGYSATLLLNDAPLTANYYTQFYYMLLTGNNPYDALELPFGIVSAETLVGDGSLVG